MKNLITIFNQSLVLFINLISSTKRWRRFTLALFFSLLFIPSSLSAACAASETCASIGDVTENEGDTGVTSFDFPVTITKNHDGVSLVFIVEHISTDGSDYVSVTTSPIVFAKKVKSGTITVNVSGDTDVEPNETFRVVLQSFSGDLTKIDDNTGIGTIINDDANSNPTFTSTPITTATESIAYSYTVTTNDTNGDAVIVAGTTIPSWLNFDGTTLSGTPSASDVGDHDVTLTADDGNGGTATQSFTITVSASSVNADPTFTSTPITTAIESIPYEYTVTTNDTNGDTVTVTGTVIPSWLDFNTTTLILSGTPTASDIGDHTVTFTADDGNSGTATQNFTITVGAAAPDLSISKIDSADPVDAGTSFDYTITVYNKGSATATNISVTDTLPSGLDINLTTSNSDSIDWNCTRSGDVLTCLHDGNISTGVTKTIVLHATAPSTTGTITNNASVSSDSDYDTSNNSASETTTIVAVGYQEIDEANELCYSDITPLTFSTYDTDCEKVGNFYYGDGCTATVLIQAYGNLTTNLTDVNITKMIAVSNNKPLDDGSCTSSQGNCTGPNPYAPDFSPSYLEAYMIPDVGTMVSDSNITITDIDTHNKKPLNQIAIYATYNYDGVYHYGRVYDCSGTGEGGVVMDSSSDAIDTPIDANNAATYNASTDTSSNGLKYIQTMVAASQRNITGVYLDVNTKETEPYIAPEGYLDADFVIIPYLVDTDENVECGTNVEFLYDTGDNELLIPIVNGAYSGTQTMVVPEGVRKDARLQLIIVDPNTLSDEGLDCLTTSSQAGNIEGIGQCGNSEIQYVGGFGVDAWDRCGLNNGSPCLPKHGGYSGGSDPTYPGYNPIYDNVLGCYMCTFDIKPACSSDNFAIRPEKFDMSMSDTDAPNLLRAGEGYGVSLTAKDALDNIPAEYTVTDHNFNYDLGTNTTRYFKDGTEDTNALLHGTSEVNTSTTGYMVSGLSSLSTTVPASAEEIVQVTYDDIGLVGLKVYDENWAAVDNDDTPMDCNSTTHTYICGESNVTFIPHHFGFSELSIINHAGPDSNFTYIADNRGMPYTSPPTRSPMASRLHAKIEALSKDGSTTKNFRADDASYPYNDSTLYYENPVDINITVTVPSTGINSYLYPDANESSVVNSYIGFGRTGLDDNGTRNVLWDESNFPLEFNFQREINEAANPFDVNGSYIQSISIVSHYTDSEDGDTADISGTRLGDWDNTTAISACATDPGCVQANAENNATFYYARTRPSKFFYDGITASPAITPIFIDVYCDLGFTACDAFGIDTVNGQINDAEWWLSWNHSSSQGDGDISFSASTNGGVTTPDIDNSGGADKTVEVSTTVIPNIVDIDFASATDAWLIYNPDNPWTPTPFYQVEFIGSSGWAGHGDTGHVVGGTSNIEKNRRLEW